MIAKRETANPEIATADPKADAESYWRDEVGVVVEHEIWHLPRLADEQNSLR